MSEPAKILVNLRGNTIEISGPENFVTAQAEAFREAIIASLTSGCDTSGENTPPAAPQQNASGNNPYPALLHIEAEKVQILKPIPGTTTSKKAVATAIVFLWGKRQAGINTVPLNDVRELCEHNGCLDGPNFSTTMKNAREWIVLDGPKGGQSCKLTVPGIAQAEKILKELNAEKGAKNP